MALIPEGGATCWISRGVRQGLLFWLFQRDFKVSLGIVYRYATDFDDSEIASPVRAVAVPRSGHSSNMRGLCLLARTPRFFPRARCEWVEVWSNIGAARSAAMYCSTNVENGM